MDTVPLEIEQLVFKASQNHRLLSDTGLYKYTRQSEILYNDTENQKPKFATLEIEVNHKVTSTNIDTKFNYKITLSEDLEREIAYNIHESFTDLVKKTVPGKYEDMSLQKIETKKYQGILVLSSPKTPINLL